MTRNLYLGTDFTDLAFETDPAQIPIIAGELWGKVQASDFPSRAKLIAAEIVATAPDLVGMQEVTLYRRQMPGDTLTGMVTPNATEVVIDFLALVMAEIDALGGGYRVAGEASNADTELPVDAAGQSFDLRVTDRDVILARDGVDTSSFVVTPFTTNTTFMAGGAAGFPVVLQRSASRVDAVVGEAQFTFGNAHLEISSLLATQKAQAQEMVDTFTAITPFVLVGDFNSAPGKSSYPIITTTFKDAHPAVNGSAGGFTCCQASDLRNPTSQANERIDDVLTRGRFRVTDVHVTGSDPATGRTPGGLWASDHFGTAATLELVP